MQRVTKWLGVLFVLTTLGAAGCGGTDSGDTPLDTGVSDIDAWVVDGAANDGRVIDAAASDAGGKAAACTASGGTVRTQLCCSATGDFPNMCTVGACTCAPASSHTVMVCDCGDIKCFNGTTCTAP